MTTRRYLTQSEVSSAIRRGKQVDAFLGAGNTSSDPTIRYLTVRGTPENVTAELWEVEDPRNPDFLDVYGLYPSNGDDVPDQVFVFPSVPDAMSELNKHFPGVVDRFVSQGVIDDEYAEYLEK